jgi:subtilase family serine protease
MTVSMSRFKSFRYGSAAAAIGVAAITMGLGIPPASAAAADGTIVYQVHPIVKLAYATSGPRQLPAPSACVAAFGLACYGPQDFRTAYDIPAADQGAGQTIVIVDAFGSPTIQSDLAVYDAEFNLPPAQLNIYYPTGTVTNPLKNAVQESWAEETSLDVEQAHGLAPAATIDLVVAQNDRGNTLNLAEGFAVNNHLGNVMSMSFGAPENLIHGNNSQQLQASKVYSAAVSQGMSVFASSGDSGASAGTSTTTSSFPASDPNVTSVGGTNLFLNDDGTYNSETTWNDAVDCPFGCTQGEFGATGGAPSILFSAPSYQSGVTGYAARTTSDVSFNASVYTATMIYLGFLGANSGLYFFGGTSEGSPSWAAITAIADSAIGHPLGELNPLLYKIYGTSAYANDFHDITVGNNDFNGPGYPARTGYDIPTGLGTPNVADLINSLAAGQ